MGLADAKATLQCVRMVVEEADDLMTAGAIGGVLSDTLQHAVELLEIARSDLGEGN